ncbi:MAG: transcriptional regulator [Candidatus Dadabacteria bacterium]|nr:transcriptional regulator [Candidatus Dadabacteria bacterium]
MIKPFSETVKETARKSAKFRIGLLNEAVICIAGGEAAVAKILLRDYIDSTIGFKKAAKLMGKEPQAVMRMLRPSGKPSLDNISKLLASLHKHEGVDPCA